MSDASRGAFVLFTLFGLFVFISGKHLTVYAHRLGLFPMGKKSCERFRESAKSRRRGVLYPGCHCHPGFNCVLPVALSRRCSWWIDPLTHEISVPAIDILRLPGQTQVSGQSGLSEKER